MQVIDRQLKASIAALLSATLLLAGCAPDAREAASPGLHVEFERGLLSVDARGAPLAQVLTTIAERHGQMLVAAFGPLDEPVSVAFERLPLDEAAGRVLGRRSYALQVEAGGEGEAPPQATLWVFAPGEFVDEPAVPASDAGSWRTQAQHSDPRRRREAVEAFGTRDVGEVLGPLGVALLDTDTEVRLTAVSVLAGVGGEQAVAMLAGSLADGEVSVREEVVDVLGDIGGAAAVTVLEQALGDPAAGVREAAVDALSEIGGEASGRALRTALRDADPQVRERALNALGDIGGPGIEALLSEALADAAPGVRETAADLLAEARGELP